MSDWGWKRYVPVTVRRKQAGKVAARAARAGAALSPVPPSRGAIAKTFWGKAWCTNLERYGDFANRLPRGRTYVRSGSVIDLVITPGRVSAQVMGSFLYRVGLRVAQLPALRWKGIANDCAGSIDSMVALLQGQLSGAVMQRLCRAGDGLFPAPGEIEFSCTCPDWASVCKHVAAVLYGIGARLDQRPELLFELRQVDGGELLAEVGTGRRISRKQPPKSRLLEVASLDEVFGIELADKPALSPARIPAAPAAVVPHKPRTKGGAPASRHKSARAASARDPKVADGKPARPAAAVRRKPRSGQQR
jgi:uncharacterized Zn finger protein